MALIRNLVLPSLIECPEAYCKITDITLSYGRKRAVLTVATYKDGEARFKDAEPIFVDEYRIYNNNDVAATNARYEVNLIQPMLVDKQNVITFDMTGDEVNEITISSLQGEALTVEQIINDLNVNETFTASWTASPYGETSFIIEAKADGARVGRAGNNASIAGNAVANCTRTITGEEARPGDFDFYFGCNVLSAQDINCLVTGYNYLKTLLLYAEAIDG